MGYTCVLGGARSGKSLFAQQVADKLAQGGNLPVTYVATSEAVDAEMEARIRRHQAARPHHWTTVEEPLDVASWLRKHQAEPHVVLIDCLSLLLNNWMYHDERSEALFWDRTNELVDALKTHPHPIVVVSNEVGNGIVPADEITRAYRDWLGWLNQAVAREADAVYWVVAGIPVDVKKWQASYIP